MTKVKKKPRAASKRTDDSRRLAVALARAADEKLGDRIKVLDVRKVTGIADYLVIASASSSPHIKAVADGMEEAVKKARAEMHHREGDRDSTWILLDCYSVIAHVFDEPTRRFYDLERLWGDAKNVKWKSGKRDG